MDCHAAAKGSIPTENGVKTEHHVLLKGQEMGVPSLNDLAADGTLNQATNQRLHNPLYFLMFFLYRNQ